MLITDELVTYLEALGRIKLPEESRAKAQSDLQEILQYIDTLSELDSSVLFPPCPVRTVCLYTVRTGHGGNRTDESRSPAYQRNARGYSATLGFPRGSAAQRAGAKE